MVTIGILGSKGKSAVAEILQQELVKDKKNVILIGTQDDSLSEFVKLINNQIDYIVIEVSREDILKNQINKIKFDMLIQTALEDETKELIKEMQGIINNLKENGYFIFNSDSIQKINFQCENIYPITYGLNGKTTVTASSVDDFEQLCFSYCLQRSITTIDENLIQPFEKPIRVKGSYEDIYYYLAAYTCLTVLGIKF